jgi:hypothetical protein
LGVKGLKERGYSDGLGAENINRNIKETGLEGADSSG